MFMKSLSFLSIAVFIACSQNAYADWKLETLASMQVHYYLPETTRTLSGTPLKKALMINLHGCAQKAEDLKKDGNWENTANDFNMIVALPKVPNGGVYSGCWDYYGADHTVNNRHNEFLIKLVSEMLAKKELGIDSAQVYISGLSSGGGESMVMGCLAPEVFAGIGLNAGPSSGTTAKEISRPSTPYATLLATCKNMGAAHSEAFRTQLTSIIYGNNDYIVNTAFNLHNAEIMREIYGADIKSTFDTTKLEGSANLGTGTLWSDKIGPRVSLIMNTGLGHNWPAGQGGNGGSFINKKSINYPEYLATFFFSNNRRAKNIQMPEVLINPIETRESKFVISGFVNIERSLVSAMEVFVKNKITESIVDHFSVEIDGNNHFSGLSKALPEGQYDFDIEVKNPTGLKRIFKRNSWLGEVKGENAPQLIGIRFQYSEGCAVLNGQALSNGESAVNKVYAILDEKETYEAEVINSLWGLKICNLEDGSHTLKVMAKNTLSMASNTELFSFMSSINTATSSVQDHMEAK
jgi:poly(3-hydroxybutyrate) depolymerase